MQIVLQKLTASKYLHLSLIAIGIAVLVANSYGREITTTVTNLLYLPTSTTLLILSAIVALRFRGRGEHGKAWIMFVVFASSWLLAEYVRYVYYVIYDNPYSFPAISHFFYHLGYLFLFLFSLYYIRPVERTITKKMLLIGFTISMALFSPTIYLTSISNQSANWYELSMAASHPIADSIVLFPFVLGMMLFFRGKVNFLWGIMCLAVTLNVIADTSVLLSSSPEYHYVRNSLDILYLWGYVLFSFGVKSHVNIFKHYKMNFYTNLEDLR